MAHTTEPFSGSFVVSGQRFLVLRRAGMGPTSAQEGNRSAEGPATGTGSYAGEFRGCISVGNYS